MDARERNLLAGEYVLGALDPAARREVEAADDAGLRQDIRWWEQRLATLALNLKPVTPRPVVWLGMLHMIEGTAPPAMRPPRLLQTWAALATAASLVLAFGLYRELRAPPPAPVMERVEVPAQVYVAQLQVPKSTMTWTVSIAADRKLAVRAAGQAPATAAQRDAELWLITAAGPVSLGVIPKSGELRREVVAGLQFASGATLAVSLEPLGGSRTGAPTGPVITSATLLQAT
ncbi:MAG: anti-sigma factor [Nevskiaceae bacterium]